MTQDAYLWNGLLILWMEAEHGPETHDQSPDGGWHLNTEDDEQRQSLVEHSLALKQCRQHDENELQNSIDGVVRGLVQ